MPILFKGIHYQKFRYFNPFIATVIIILRTFTKRSHELSKANAQSNTRIKMINR